MTTPSQHRMLPILALLACVPAYAQQASQQISPADLESARKALKESEARLDATVKSFQEASSKLRRMADCEYNDTREKDLEEINDRNHNLQAAFDKLKASLRRLDSDGKTIFSRPVVADACSAGPADLKGKIDKFEELLTREFNANFAPNRPSEIEQAARAATPGLNKALQNYRRWNCGAEKSGFDFMSKEACRRYKVCSRGADPAEIYQNVLAHFEKGKLHWVGPNKGEQKSLKESLQGLKTSVTFEGSRLSQVASACNSAAELASVPVRKDGASELSGEVPAALPPERVTASIVAPREPARIPEVTEQVTAPLPVEAPRAPTPLAGVTGAILREEKAAAVRVTGAEAAAELPAPRAEVLIPPPAVAVEPPRPAEIAAAKAAEPTVPEDNSPWKAPDWRSYDRYKDSIGAPNIVKGIDLDRTYTSFLATNSIQIRSVDDAVRLQRAINATSMEVNGADSLGPSVYQDGVVGRRTKSAIYMMESNSVYRDVFLRELRKQGFSS